MARISALINNNIDKDKISSTVMPTKSDSDVILCLQLLGKK